MTSLKWWIAFTAGIVSCWCLALSPEDLAELQRHKISQFKVDLHHTLEGARIRQKRKAGLLYSIPDKNAFMADHLRVSSSSPEDLPYLSASDLTFWTSFNYFDRRHLLVGTTNGQFMLFDLTEAGKGAQLLANSTGEDVGYKAKAFTHYYEQWFAILHSTGTQTIIRLYQRIGRGLERRQTIILEGEADLDLITIKGVHYMAVALYRAKTGQGFTYQARLQLYRWKQTQFDVVASRVVYGASSLACWELDGMLYIATTQQTNDEGNLLLGSLVFLYNSIEGDSLLLLDNLQTNGPRKVAHFFVAGSHYLIFIGQSDAIIYWWSSEQFLKWQVITGTAFASDVSVLTLRNGEVILVISLKEEILFLTLDATGHYIITFSMKFAGFSISSLQFMYTSAEYFALALFQPSLKPLPHSVWKLGLDMYSLPTESAMDPLMQCLNTMEEILDQRKMELETVRVNLSNVWLANKDQLIVSDVILQNSLLSSNNAIIDEVVVSTNVSGPLPTELERDISSLNIVDNSLRYQFNEVVLKSAKQEIKGVKEFTSTVMVPSLSTSDLYTDIIVNGLSIYKLATQTLKKFGDQVITSPLQLPYMSAETVIAGKIDDFDITDFVLLKGQQIITGDLKFSNIYGTNIAVYGAELNGILLENLVTTNTPQTINELKTFDFLQSYFIDTEGLFNGVDLRDIEKKIITVDTNQNITGRFDFKSAMNVKDNLVVGLVNNNIDLSHLQSASVKKNEYQEIKGSKVFLKPVSVAGNVRLVGLLNNIDIDNLFTIQTDQTVLGNLHFTSALTIGDIFTDRINNIDLVQAVVLRNSGVQHVYGHKFLGKPLTTGEINVLDFVKINDIDLSAEAERLVQHKKGVVNAESAFQNVVVLGNLTALHGINGLYVFDLPDTVWLKSQNQVITAPVITTNITAEDDIEVIYVNDIDLELDTVLSFGDQDINSFKTFRNDVEIINNINLDVGRLLDGADIASFNKSDIYTDKLELGVIRGIKILSSLEVMGNIKSEIINDHSFPNDLVQTNLAQNIKGNKIFSTAFISSLNSSSITVSVLNDFDLKKSMSNIVLKNDVNRLPVQNKIFENIRANGLSFNGMTKIDGVSIPEMQLRVVTLNTDQYISEPKTFSQISVQDTAIAGKINDLDVVSLANSVILSAQKEAVTGHKVFTGATRLADISVDEPINDVNLTYLSTYALSQTGNNIIPSFVFFDNDLDVGSLTANALVDEVKMVDTYHLHSDEIINKPLWILSDMEILGDMFVTGLINDCNLNDVVNFALHTKKGSQQVEGDIQLNNLFIEGNLYINTFNYINLEEATSIVTTDVKDQVISGDFHIYSGTSIKNIDVKGALNGVNILHLMKDAVRKSVSQVITAHKTLEKDLGLVILVGGDVFLQNTLNGIILEKLFHNTVLKSEFQLLHGEKILHAITADNVTIYGYINGLQLPYDVILSSTSEKIENEVFMLKNVILQSNLQVNGRIDGVYLSMLLAERVTLSKAEEINSKLTFNNNTIIYGQMSTDTINDVVLEMVVRSGIANEIWGFKEFVNGLFIFENLYIQNELNGVIVHQLPEVIVKHNANEHLRYLQVFDKPIYCANSLYVPWINDVLMPNVTADFEKKYSRIGTILNFSKQLSLAQDKQLVHQMKASKYQTPDLAYFELTDEIYLGSATRILTSFIGKSNVLVMWTKKSDCESNKCCSKEFSHLLLLNQTGLITEGVSQAGRYYPLSYLDSFETGRNFVVWSNSTSVASKWCHAENVETIFGLFHDGYLQRLHEIKNSPFLSDVRAFKDDYLYLVASYYFDTVNYEYSPTILYFYDYLSYKWKEYQVLPVYGILSMDLTTFIYGAAKEILLALGTGVGTYPDSYSSIYRWNDIRKQFELYHQIPSQFVVSTGWFKKDNDQYLAMASLDSWSNEGDQCSRTTDGGEINVYRYEYSKMQWIQNIPLQGVISVAAFSLVEETYLAAASKHLETVYIFRWDGQAKFVIIRTFYMQGVSHLNVLWLNKDLYVIAASDTGPSKVFRAVIRGGLRPAVATTNDAYISDQASYNSKRISDC